MSKQGLSVEIQGIIERGLNMDLKTIVEASIFIITACGAIYGMMKFLLKDIMSRLDLIDKHIGEIKDDQTKMDQRVLETNKRMDGVYNVLLARSGMKTEGS